MQDTLTDDRLYHIVYMSIGYILYEVTFEDFEH